MASNRAREREVSGGAGGRCGITPREQRLWGWYRVYTVDPSSRHGGRMMKEHEADCHDTLPLYSFSAFPSECQTGERPARA